MPISKPSTTDLVVKQDYKGRMRLFFKDLPIPGILSIAIAAKHNETAEVTVVITARSVRFEIADEVSE